jgi:hypothetical protein
MKQRKREKIKIKRHDCLRGRNRVSKERKMVCIEG